MNNIVKIIILVTIIILVSCNKSEKKDKIEVKEEKIITFNIEKKCSFCHDLPKLSEKTDSYIEAILAEHIKARKIRHNDKEFKALLKQVKEFRKKK